MPTTHIHPDYETMSAAAASLIADRLQQRPNLLLCLATGSTPTRTYELLAQRPKSLFNHVRILKLDEWGGIPMNSPATCETYLHKLLIDPLKLASRYIGFESQPADPVAECARIADWLKANGPIDLCILGLGTNGHLGFNEPADNLQPLPHIAKLSVESLGHSMVQALPTKPTFGLTLGIQNILDSREILVVVSGPSKVQPLRRMLNDPLNSHFPATYLQKHGNTHVFCDRAAAQEIS
jgi:galactosamine-6-phosphate isomerase